MAILQNIRNRFIKIIVGLLLLLAVTVPTAAYFRFVTEADHVLAESKNAELALRLLAMEYYGKGLEIYDPLRPDGMAEGVAEEVRHLSGAEGTLILSSWDGRRHAPSGFTYTSGKLLIVYDYDKQTAERWRSYYQFRDMQMPN